jgi:hypothetical protein
VPERLDPSDSLDACFFPAARTSVDRRDARPPLFFAREPPDEELRELLDAVREPRDEAREPLDDERLPLLLPERAPEELSTLSRLTSLLKLLRWPPAVSSCTIRAKLFSSNFSNHSSQSISSREPAPL